ncbi:unnamed protein product [Sympodiomycopsis kandeliae]
MRHWRVYKWKEHPAFPADLPFTDSFYLKSQDVLYSKATQSSQTYLQSSYYTRTMHVIWLTLTILMFTISINASPLNMTIRSSSNSDGLLAYLWGDHACKDSATKYTLTSSTYEHLRVGKCANIPVSGKYSIMLKADGHFYHEANCQCEGTAREVNKCYRFDDGATIKSIAFDNY